ncbi:histidinol-phosphate transaminase [Companilactobacillus nodensis]|uniref:Histidinol-phosphate aminotransferase n=1 Tax=Companilactobacillus nodensis DSM 19682 = JCM 14932 = NBRC 107160 TaxID=1423775 RepID=A0A0R1KEI2_9LACO|nr:histidinol-phosphate transaminase [Companilactobacillus nodensis]KRK79273.1 histidinol-phosphate aminotransferase [Companilactobacillus nodensis DSM 19682 = JCM 14932 = NBRC 107160]
MKKIIQQLQPYIPEKPLEQLKQELGLKKLVRLSANENPYGTSPTVKEAVLNWNYDQSNRYPDGDATELRGLISKKFELDPEQIVFGVGLDEVIVMLSRVFLSPGDVEMVSTPTFSEYALHAEIEQANITKVPVLASGQIDFAGMLQAITDATKLIWICNPNNPTGTIETVADIEKFVAKVPDDVMVLVDEAYIDFASEPNATAMSLTKKYPNIVVMRTFSKAYGLANFRVGYAVFPQDVGENVQKVRLPYNVNSVAQVAATAAFKDTEFVADVVKKNDFERELWEEFFEKEKIKYYPSQANFVFFEYPDANKLADYLLHNGYLLRTGLQKNWLRLTVGTKTDNEELRNLIYSYK